MANRNGGKQTRPNAGGKDAPALGPKDADVKRAQCTYGGRLLKMSAARSDAICDFLKAGATHTAAAGAAGITVRTFEYWRARGRVERDRIEELVDKLPDDAPDLEPDPKAKPFYDFLIATETAEAIFEARAVKLIAKAAEKPNHWAAAKFLLERRRPETYGQREKLEFSGAIEHRHMIMSAEQVERANAIMARYGIEATIAIESTSTPSPTKALPPGASNGQHR